MKTRSRIAVPLLIAGCAILFSAGESLQYYFRVRLQGREFRLSDTVVESLTTWLMLALLTPIAFAMSRRFRLERGRLATRIPLHVLAGVVFAIGAIFGIALVIHLRKPELPLGLMFGKVGTLYALFYFAVYWGITGAIHAAQYQREAQQREEKLVRERLDVLRSKLNPHFLFNTLNAISTMALQRDHEGVAQSLGLVGDMLRASLDYSLPQEIPLSRELELTEKYLAIQRIRFGERLRIERAIDPDSLRALVPSMLLQPIVENAIIHGVGAKPGAGWVKIEARASDGQLLVLVSDSGGGFREAPRNGIGLTNTRERLQTLYGSQHRFETGESVAITMPLREAP